jgi:hypothetical protein
MIHYHHVHPVRGIEEMIGTPVKSCCPKQSANGERVSNWRNIEEMTGYKKMSTVNSKESCFFANECPDSGI